MKEQIVLTGFEPPEYKEVAFLDSIIGKLREAAEMQDCPGHLITYRSTKSAKSGNSGHTSVFLSGFTAFRIHMRGKQYYISVPSMFRSLISPSFHQKETSSEPKYIRVIAENQSFFYDNTEFLCRLVAESVNRYPKEWDCCSRYRECSDAKRCIHPDKEFALCCGYREILRSGRVFYGKNRNI